MDNLNFLPQIDFNYWYQISENINQEKNERNEPIIKRHHAVINMVYEKYKKGIKTAYFSQFDNENEIVEEVNRLKRMTYYELENEIIILVNVAIKNNFYIDNDDEVELTLKIFDLIQIWGGIPGGGGPYQTKNNINWRINPDKKWIRDYKNASKLAYDGETKAYDEFRKLKHLGGLAFASKHAFFYSKCSDKKSLVIIDVKIAHCFLIQRANYINKEVILKILDFINNASKENKLLTWQIEKALFTFHLINFKDKIRIPNDNNIDVQTIDIIANWYNISESKTKHVDSKKSFEKIKVSKSDFFNLNGVFFISAEYYSKSNNKTLIDTKSNINYKGRILYEYIGDKERLTIA